MSYPFRAVLLVALTSCPPIRDGPGSVVRPVLPSSSPMSGCHGLVMRWEALIINIWIGQQLSSNSLNIKQVNEMAGMECMEACRLTNNILLTE